MTARGAARSDIPFQDSCTATDLASARTALRGADTIQWNSSALRGLWGHVHESWLVASATEIGVVEGSGFAVVATGSLGRRELLPHSDIDLLLLHDGMPPDSVRRTAEQLWYPLWDANVRLDHSVRTIPEALQVAGTDIVVGLAMLDARHIAGDGRLSAGLIRGTRDQWRRTISARLDELVETTHTRWERSGDIAHHTEPDVKCARGGLRDAQLLDALAVTRIAAGCSLGQWRRRRAPLRGAYRTLLDVRTELHRLSGRAHDLLGDQYTEQVSAALGMSSSDDLAARMTEAARTISWRVDTALGTAARALAGRNRLTVLV